MSHLGDVVCALPVFHALRGAHPEAALGWVVQSEFAGLLEGLPGLQRVFRFQRRGGWRAWLRLRRELRAFAPELAVDAQGNLKSAAALLLSGAPRRAGLHPSEWRERTGARALTEHAPPSGGSHAIERMQALGRYAAGGGGPLRADPGLSAAERAAGRAELARLLPAGASDVALLHLSPPSDVRGWPLERFGELARLLAARGRPVLVVSGPGEEEQGLALARELGQGPVRHLVGQRDLRRLAALFAAAAERGGAFAGADSGPMHLACAAGPVASGVVRAAPAPACAPCLRRTCSHPDGPVCMRGIGAAQVAAALGAR